MALLSWPWVTLLIYRRFPVGRATIVSVLTAYLLLPVSTAIDLPMIPPMDKFTVSNLAAFAVCRYVLGKRIVLLPRFRAVRLLVLLYIISPFATALLNHDPIMTGPLFIKGMNAYDALSAVIRQLLFILPFILGLNFLNDASSHEDILLILIVSALFYSLPMLFEIRMSPQLHRWIYGFFPHSFVQQMRYGGFRPVVFLGHGLLVAFFTMSALVAAVTFSRIRRPVLGFQTGLIIVYLAVVLLLCKSMASVLYAVFMIVIIKTMTPRFQVRVARILVIMVILYPMMRSLEWFPVTQIKEIAVAGGQERAQSLQYRLDNEEILLTKARQRPLFGWGSWGRNRVYDQKTGKDISVTDGRWIIVMGEFGWVGFLAEFGLLALPVISSVRALAFVTDRRERIVLSSISLLMAISLVDLLPNSTVTPWTWLLAGALLGRVEAIRSSMRSAYRKPENNTGKAMLRGHV